MSEVKICLSTIICYENLTMLYRIHSRALKVLRSRLLQQKQAAYDEAYNAQRQSQVGSGDRSEKIRTYNFPQDRVTDHRIGLTLRNLQSVLDGDLDRVLDPLILADREEKLKANKGDA